MKKRGLKSEEAWDALKDARHAEQSALEAQPPGPPTHVHQDAGLVQVLKRSNDGWLYRTEGGFSVDRAAKGELREVLSAKGAAELLKRLEKAPEGKVPSDADRRARLRRSPTLLDISAVEREFTYFAGLVAAGASLWTMEKVPFQRLRSHLVAELSLALGRPVTLPDLS